MMVEDSAALFSDENFASFDSFEDENYNFHNAIPKQKKKNDFNFTSLWRKPKLGRRKIKGDGKGQGPYDGSSENPSRIGKYFKDRESFETAGSVPLSDFDEAKDTLPFLNFRTGFSNREEEGKSAHSNSSRILKERTLLNPKMFLTPTPTKPSESNKNMKSEHTVSVKSSKDESCDLFNNFDAFQNLSKVSSGAKETEGDLSEKENFFQDSVYGGELYHDHGPILSSLSEDTIFSDSIRGERFLDDNFNETYQNNNWNPSRNVGEEQNKGGWNVFTSSHHKEENNEEPTPEENASDQIETSVRSFSDRLKLFQSKSNQPGERPTSGLSKQPSRVQPINRCASTEISHEEESTENVDRVSSPLISEIEIPAPNIEKDQTLIQSDISEVDDKNMNEEKIVSNCREFNEKLKPSEYDSDAIASKAERNLSEAQAKEGEIFLPFPVKRDQQLDERPLQTAAASQLKSNSVESEGSSKSDCPQNSSDVSSLTMFSNSSVNQYASKFGVTLSKRRDPTSRRGSGEPNNSKDVSPSLEGSMRNQVEGLIIKGINEHLRRNAGLEECTDKIERMCDVSPSETINSQESDGAMTTKSESDINAITDNPLHCQSDRPASSFAQQSASIFGVKLSKSRNRKTKTFQNKESVCQLHDKAIVTGESEERRCARNSLGKQECVRKLSEKDNNADGEYKQRRKSTSSDATEVRTVCQAKQDVETSPLEQYQSHELDRATRTLVIDDHKKGDDRKSIASVDREVSTRTLVIDDHKKGVDRKSFASVDREVSTRTLVILDDHKKGDDRKSFTSVDREVSTRTLVIDDHKKGDDRKSFASVDREVSTRTLVIDNHKKGDDRKSCVPLVREVELVPSKEKRKTSSLAERMKMFERVAISCNAVGSKESQVAEVVVCDKSPETIEKSRPPSIGERTVVAKRKSTDDKIEMGKVESQIPSRKSVSSLNSNDDNKKFHQTDGDDEDLLGNRRRTLRSVPKGVKCGSGALNSNSNVVVSNDLEKSEISVCDAADNDSKDDAEDTHENRRKTMNKVRNEIHNHGEMYNEGPVKELSPVRAACSARRKFFEKFDRGRVHVQSSMSRPFHEKKQTIIDDITAIKKQEIESLQDDSSHIGDGLPRFVTVEEDFLLRDNISTCLSASENRSVVCKPDALLYSVSQKAIALMTSSKTEKVSKPSLSIALKNAGKESSCYGSENERLGSSNKTDTNLINHTTQDDDNSNQIQPSIENRGPSRMRTAANSQRYNRFARKISSREFSNDSSVRNEAATGNDAQENNINKARPSVENSEPNRKRTSSHNFHRFPKKSASSEVSHESDFEKTNVGEDTHDDRDRNNNRLTENKAPVGKWKVASSQNFKHNRFTRADVTSGKAVESKKEDASKLEKGTNAAADVDKAEHKVEVVACDEIPKVNATVKPAPRRFKSNRFTRKDIALYVPGETKKGHDIKLENQTDNNDFIEDSKDSEAAVQNYESDKSNKPATSQRFQYNRFTRKDVILNKTLESHQEQDSNDSKENGKNDEPAIERQEPKEVTKQAPDRFKQNRFVRKDEQQASKLKNGIDANNEGEGKHLKDAEPADEKQEPQEVTKQAPNRFKYNRFVRKDEQQAFKLKNVSSKLTNEIDANNEGDCKDLKDGEPAIEKQEPQEVTKHAPNRFKCKRVAVRDDIATDTSAGLSHEQGSVLESVSDSNDDATASNTRDAKLSIGYNEATPAPNRLKYDRFKRKGALMDKREQASSIESKIGTSVQYRCEDKAGESIENEVRNEKAASHRLKHNRFDRKDVICDTTDDSKQEGPKSESELDGAGNIENKARNKLGGPSPSLRGKCNRFAKKITSSDVRLQCNKDGEVEDDKDEQPVAASSTDTNEALKSDETSVEPQKTHMNANNEVPSTSSQRLIPSRSIRERRMFFESQMKNSK